MSSGRDGAGRDLIELCVLRRHDTGIEDRGDQLDQGVWRQIDNARLSYLMIWSGGSVQQDPQAPDDHGTHRLPPVRSFPATGSSTCDSIPAWML
jgi:hypothetical protein